MRSKTSEQCAGSELLQLSGSTRTITKDDADAEDEEDDAGVRFRFFPTAPASSSVPFDCSFETSRSAALVRRVRIVIPCVPLSSSMSLRSTV
jgi:hypothetical protein